MSENRPDDSVALTTLLDMFLVLLFIAVCVLWSGWEFIKAYRGKLDVPASSLTPRWLERTAAATTYGISLNMLDQLRAVGKVRAKRAGGAILVEVASLDEWVEELDDA